MSCDYSDLASSLDLDAQGSFQVSFEPEAAVDPSRFDVDVNELCNPAQNIDSWVPPLNQISIKSSLATMIDESLWLNMPRPVWIDRTSHFESSQLGIISRFRERTSLTIGNSQMAPLYRDMVCQLACKVRLSHEEPILWCC